MGDIRFSLFQVASLRTVALSIQKILLDAFPASRSYAARDLDHPAMPQEIAHFLAKTLTRRLDFELERMTSEWFDFDAEPVCRAIGELRTALEPTARIPAHEWETTLFSATRAVLSHLVRPAHTLTGFVFGPDQTELSIDVVLRRMAYFKAYPYLYEIISQYVIRKQFRSIEKDSFLDLLTQADRMMVSDFSPEEWKIHLKPLFSLVMEHSSFNTGVPFHLLRAHFSDKGLEGLLSKLVQTYQTRGVTEFSPAALEVILSPDDSNVGNKSFADRPLPRTETGQTPTARSTESRSIPRWKEYRNPPGPTIAKRTGESGSTGPLQPMEPSGYHRGNSNTSAGDGLSVSTGSPLENPNRTVASTPAHGIPIPPELPTLTPREGSLTLKMSAAEASLFGNTPVSERQDFIRRLFGSDERAYVRVLEKLNRATNWEQASEIIANDVFSAYNIDIYSDEALSFTDAVQEGFGKFRHS